VSRAYTIRVSQSIRRHVRVEDGVQTNLEVLAVLSREEMTELLAAQLLELGFEREGNVLSRVDEDGVTISIDAETSTVTVRLAAETEVNESIERSARIYEERLVEGKARLEKSARAELEGHVDEERARLTGEVAEKLEAKLRDLRRELDGAATRATAAALKVRAAQLGEIQQIDENEETGEITIKVKV
jgi:hypothetical protein